MTRINKIFFLLALTIASSSSRAEDYAVIVNPNNTVSGSELMAAEEVRRLFLRETLRWSNGLLSTAISTPSTTKSFMAFRTAVLKMSQEELQAHWLTAEQSGQGGAPRETRSENLVARLVGRDLGSFGIISRKLASQLDGEIRILFTF
jgi:hypothetical protein